MKKNLISDNLKTVRFLLPGYVCTEEKAWCIECKSNIGISDDALWEKFFNNIRFWFGETFQEVYHETCYNHKHFYIYYKPKIKQ